MNILKEEDTIKFELIDDYKADNKENDKKKETALYCLSQLLFEAKTIDLSGNNFKKLEIFFYWEHENLGKFIVNDNPITNIGNIGRLTYIDKLKELHINDRKLKKSNVLKKIGDLHLEVLDISKNHLKDEI